MGCSSSKPHRAYNPDIRRKKKQNKVKELQTQYKTLQKRKSTEGDTKWIKNALTVLEGRMKRAGVKKTV